MLVSYGARVLGPSTIGSYSATAVPVEIGSGAVVTASITNEAVDALGLKVGQAAYAVIKASDVMVAVD